MNPNASVSICYEPLHSVRILTFTLDRATQIFPETLSADVVPAITARFQLLNAEDQLALIWYAYLEMGQTITIAAPGAARMQFAERLLNDIKAMSFAEQSQLMCDLANRTDNEVGRTYANWSVNIKLGFWYKLGQWMQEGLVAPIPEGYRLSANAAAVLNSVKAVDQGQQITLLRNFVVDMGFDPAKGEGQRVMEPVADPTAEAERKRVFIEGVINPTVNAYMDLLNANDFDNLIQLFLPDGALQLFVVGTVLPHRRAEACGNRHRAESLALPPWLSLLACYHFGYHWEHHEYPQVPWFGLAGVRRQHLDQLQLSSIRLTR